MKQSTKVICIDIPETLHNRFKGRAASTGKKLKEAVIEAMIKWLEDNHE